MFRRFLAGSLFVLLVVGGLLPGAAAHGQAEANELEWYVLEDEADDSFYATGGYDVFQVFLGEAYEPEAGGDGVYFRTVLYGDPSAGVPPGGDLEVAFTFLLDGEPVTRVARTSDGKAFEGDFDVLRVEPGDGEVTLYGFLLGEPAGLGPGSTLTAFSVVSSYAGEPRDVAPGGIYVPGSMGLVEVPFPSAGRVTEAATLEGPGKYLTVEVRDLGEGGFLLDATSALKKGGQHLMLDVPVETPGWTVTPSGATSEAVEPAGTASFGVTVAATGDPGTTPAPLALHVLSDLGGRVTVYAVHTADGPRLVPADDLGALEQVPLAGGIDAVPGPGVLLAAVAGAAAAALARRRA